MNANQVGKLPYSIISTCICCAVLILYCALYKKGKRMHFEDVVLAGILIVLSSIRYGVGSDYFRYLESSFRWARMFETNIRSLFSADVISQYSFEIGYKILSVLSHKISQSPYTIFWLVSVVIYIPLIVYCRKNTKDARFAIAVYLLFGYWGMSLNVIGQSVSMIYVLYLENAIEQKKYIYAVFFALCAVAFHTTAIVAVIIVILAHLPFGKNFLNPTKVNLLKMIIIGIVARGGTELLRSILSRNMYTARYARYLSTGVSEIGRRIYMMIGACIETILVILIVFMVVKRLDGWDTNNQKLQRFASIVMIGIPFGIVGISRSDWLWLSIRFAEYFFVFLIALIPEMLDISPVENERRGIINIDRKKLPFWVTIIAWHAIFAVIMFNNNQFVLDTYLFK